TAILMLSLSRDVEYIAAALGAGASGYILKDEAAAHLLTALAAVGGSKHYLSPSALAAVSEFASSATYGAIEREVLALFDRHAAQLWRCATAAGANDDAIAALEQTFLAYTLARAGKHYIPKPA